MFDEEIPTSKPLLEHSTSILGVWVNHVMIHKNITLYYQKQKHEGPCPGEAACSIFIGVLLNRTSLASSLLGRLVY